MALAFPICSNKMYSSVVNAGKGGWLVDFKSIPHAAVLATSKTQTKEFNSVDSRYQLVSHPHHLNSAGEDSFKWG